MGYNWLMGSRLPNEHVSAAKPQEPRPKSVRLAGAKDSDQESRKKAGVYVRKIRQRSNISAKELSSRLNVSRPFVTTIEGGLKQVPFRAYAAWATALEVDPATFVKTLLSLYQPETARAIFPEKATGHACRQADGSWVIG